MPSFVFSALVRCVRRIGGEFPVDNFAEQRDQNPEKIPESDPGIPRGVQCLCTMQKTADPEKFCINISLFR